MYIRKVPRDQPATEPVRGRELCWSSASDDGAHRIFDQIFMYLVGDDLMCDWGGSRIPVLRAWECVSGQFVKEP